MKVLVTGGTGVVGRATITELLARGHEVRLLSRGAADDVAAWDGPVEAFAADVADGSALRGSADGCSAVIHIVGIIDEDPPDATFERINVGGTANILAEADRAGVTRLVFVSSLGVDRGSSDYHASKRAAEELVRGYRGDWCIARTGAVMGPGDETVSVLLRLVRTLPVVPVIGGGEQQFQPVWHEDVARALVSCIERDDTARRVLNIAGLDVLTYSELLDLFSEGTDRKPIRLPLPSFIARGGTSLADALGIGTPVSTATLMMLLEGNILMEHESNHIVELLGEEPEPSRARLVQLMDEQPVQTPQDGVGRLQRRRFRVDIDGARCSATELMDDLRRGFDRVVPFEATAEPGTPSSVEEGATLTLELPGRGHVQVRVEEVAPLHFTLATLEGHPLAGLVRFHSDDIDDRRIRFTIDVIERPASRIDQLSMALVGGAAQKRTWIGTAENVVAVAGGSSPDGVMEETWSVGDEEAEPLDQWAEELVRRRERRDNRS